MEVLKWKEKNWLEIPYQDKPIENEECLIIAKRICAPPPKENPGLWEVLWWRQDIRNDMAWDIEYVALFWDFEYAEIFCDALANGRQLNPRT